MGSWLWMGGGGGGVDEAKCLGKGSECYIFINWLRRAFDYSPNNVNTYKGSMPSGLYILPERKLLCQTPLNQRMFSPEYIYQNLLQTVGQNNQSLGGRQMK